MIKEDIKIGLLFIENNRPDILYQITELTIKGFKYELAEKEKFPNGIGGIPRMGISFLGEGEIFCNEHEYILQLYNVVEQSIDYNI